MQQYYFKSREQNFIKRNKKLAGYLLRKYVTPRWKLFFLVVLIVLLIAALASGYPVAFALPGSAIITIGLAALFGELFAGDVGAYFSEKDTEDALWNGHPRYPGVFYLVCGILKGKQDGAILAEFNQEAKGFDCMTLC